MNKKVIIIVLAAGAIIAIALGILLSFKTKEIKAQMEQTLNQSFTSYVAEYYPVMSWEQFVCNGLTNIQCYSKEMKIGDEDINFVLHNVGLDIHSINNSSFKSSFNIKDVKINVGKETIEEFGEDMTNLLLSFFPYKLKCDISLEGKTDTIHEQIKCGIFANNANYDIKGEGIYLHENFKKSNIIEILQNFYFRLILDDETPQVFEDFKYSPQIFSIKTTDEGFAQDIYKYFELKDGVSNREEFIQSITKFKNLFALLANLTLGSAYQSEIEDFGNALESYLLGNTHKLGIAFMLKNNREQPFISFDNLNGEQLWDFLDNYNLLVSQ